MDVKGKGDPTGAVLNEIDRHDLRDAIVRVIVKADPEAELLLQDRPIQQALYDAGVNHVASIQRDVERPARMRLGAAPEGMTPEQLLERYLLTKDLPQDRIDVLLDHARAIDRTRLRKYDIGCQE